MQEKSNNLTQIIAQPDFWDNPEQAAAIMQDKSYYDHFINSFAKIQTLQADLFIMEEDPDMAAEFSAELAQTQEELSTLVRKLYLSCAFDQPCDKLDCFIHIQAGAGGLESEDWAAMLMNMYRRFCDIEGYDCSMTDFSAGERPGLINRAILEVKSTNNAKMPYGWLKHEHGIHRLVRISPFDSNARRHTSFASVWVTPKLNQEVNIEIKPEELEIKECRASGAGGQHVNKTNSAIQITHLPTGITAQSQQERSQHQNREIAMSLLKSKLYVHKMNELQAENAKHIMSKTDVSWGNQIRSYTLEPYQLVKDKRTGLEISNVQSVLLGYIKPFMESCVELSMK